MSDHSIFQAEFPKATIFLKEFFDQFSKDISSFSQSSSELYHTVKQDLLQSWSQWPEVVKTYRNAVSNLPKELRQRDFIKKSMKDLSIFEKDVHHFFVEFKENKHLIHLEERIELMKQQIADLEKHPVIQKFLRGEMVLASINTIQWGRKFTHIFLGTGFLYLFVFSGLSQTQIWCVAGPFVIWSFFLETLRHVNPRVNEWVCRYFRPIMREREKSRVNSAIFFIVSMGLVYFIFPVEVTILTMLFIAIGDPAAGVVGVYWGKRKLSANVSLEGSLACFITCTVMAAIAASALFDHTLSIIPLIFFSILSGLVGAFAEASFKKLDDNFVMPVLSAPALWILMRGFSII